MNTSSAKSILAGLGFVSCMAFANSSFADTLYFQPSLNAQGNITELWSSVENWYFALTPMPIAANRLPAAGDTVYIVLSEYACIVDVPSVEVAQLITDANIVGGDFNVQTVQSTSTTFNGATLNIQNEWQSSNDQLVNGTANILSGALLFIDGDTLYVNNSTIYDIGQIELMGDATLSFSSGTNSLSVTKGAQFTSVGNNELFNAPGNPLTFDNNGFIESDNGTLTIESDNIFWTNSLGSGYFTNATSNAVIEIFGPFAVQTNCTNFITGPGTFLLYNGIETTVNGILQVGIGDPVPGTLDYHAYTLDGQGSVNISGAPGLPSVLLWESGTFAGPTVNIDSNSQLIFSNIYTKTISHSVVNNAGQATWLVDGNTLQLDNGAVFNNLASGVFTAENSAVMQGGAGSNSSFFYNAGTFRKSVSSNPVNFAQDNPPAPSFYFLNSGALDVLTGALYLEWGTNSGQYNVGQGGAQLHFWNGTNSQTSTASFTGPGLFAVDSGNLWLENNLTISNLQMELNGKIDGPGDLDINGLLLLGSGTVQGSGALNINPDASLLIISNPVTLLRNVNNSGYATVTNSSVFAGQPLTWNNLPQGSLNLSGGLGNTIGYSGPPPILNNSGSFSNSGPTSLTSTVNWTVTNSGLLVANPYALDLDQSFIQTAGVTQVNPGANLSVSSSYGNTFQLRGGILEGQGVVTGFITNSATIHPGDSPGILSIGFGSLTNESGSTLAVDIAGPTPGSQYGQLNENNGVAWLNNLTLAITFDNGFVPSVGQSFVIWTNVQPRGIFAATTGNQIGQVILTPHYSQNSVTLVASVNPALLSLSVTNNVFTFTFQSTLGVTNIIQYSDSLSPPNWLTLTTLVGNGSAQSFLDNISTNASRFYRLVPP